MGSVGLQGIPAALLQFEEELSDSRLLLIRSYVVVTYDFLWEGKNEKIFDNSVGGFNGFNLKCLFKD